MLSLQDEICYKRRYFNVHLKADISQLNLPHGTKKLKSGRKERLIVSPEEKKEVYGIDGRIKAQS